MSSARSDAQLMSCRPLEFLRRYHRLHRLVPSSSQICAMVPSWFRLSPSFLISSTLPDHSLVILYPPSLLSHSNVQLCFLAASEAVPALSLSSAYQACSLTEVPLSLASTPTATATCAGS